MLVRAMLNVLLTNDDGIEADGLQAMRRALARARRRAPGGDRARRQPLGDGALDHHAPAAVGRGGAVRRRQHRLRDRRHAGRLRAPGEPRPGRGLRRPIWSSSGINHGANLGDDITYSGTVAAALEGVVLGLPAIAVSQQSRARRARLQLRRQLRLRDRGSVRGAPGRRASSDVPLPPRDAAQRQRAGRRSPSGVEVDAASASASTATSSGSTREEEGRRRYWIYGTDPGYQDEPGHRPRGGRRRPHRA